MGYFDLNIPYHESDRHAADKTSLKSQRLKLALKAIELGYTGIAYNRTLKGVMSESDRCSTAPFPISSLLKLVPSCSALSAAVKFHREILNVSVSTPFRQYTRLTVIVDVSAQASVLNAGNPILKSYDIVAVRPMNQNAFDQACQTSEVDIISIDFSDKLPFRLKQPMVKAAIKRGVYFEITYSGLISDAQSRRQMISNCRLLVDWTRGKNLIFSSASSSATELRGPLDVSNLLSLIGLPMEHAKAAISKNCRSLLAHALRKKQFYKEAVKVEAIIPPHGKVNPKHSLFDDWLKWDPISSGDGDLLLDDIEKSFSESNPTVKTVKAIDFTSNLNGLQIKDLISVIKAAPGPSDSDKPEKQDSLETSSKKQDENIQESEVSGSGFEESETPSLPSNTVPTTEELVATISSKKQNWSEPKPALAEKQLQDVTTKAESIIPVSENDASMEFFSPSNKFSLLKSEESILHGQEGVTVDKIVQLEESSVCTQGGVAVDKIPDEIQEPSLASSDESRQDVNIEGEKITEIMDKLPIVQSSNSTTSSNKPVSGNVTGEWKSASSKSLAGEKRKRNAPPQPYLSPFKRLLNPKHPKKKSRKYTR